MGVMVNRCAGLDVHRDDVVATVRVAGPGRCEPISGVHGRGFTQARQCPRSRLRARRRRRVPPPADGCGRIRSEAKTPVEVGRISRVAGIQQSRSLRRAADRTVTARV